MNDIHINRNDKTLITLFDTHDITVNRGSDNSVEIVIHPCAIGKASIRFAKNPYVCTLHLANGEDVSIDLDNENDWGDIQGCNPDDCEDWQDALGWGNDEDGHVKIVGVTDEDGLEIPLDEFKRDVADFCVYHMN